MNRERNAAGQGPHGTVRTGEEPVVSAAGTTHHRPGRGRLGLQRGLMSCLVACLAFHPWLPLGAQGASAPALPALGDPASVVLPLGEERRLGERLMQQVWRSPMYLDDPVTLAYVQSLWERLMVTARARGDVAPELDDSFAWSLFLIRDRTLNAFALPGGHVGVHLGLLAVTRSADEFAAVLAHELTHVSQRHIARGFATGQRQSALGTAALLLGLLLAARAGSPDMAQAAVAGSQAAMIQGQLNFSREMEREADRIGAAIHAQAGFSPLGTAAMFDRLEQAARLNDSGALAYLRTHPLGSERLADARARAALLPPQPPVLTPMHALMQGRARVLMEPSAQHWQRLVSAVDDLPASAGGDTRNAGATAERLADLYAAALAASGLGEHAQAHALGQALDEAATLVGAADPAVRTAIGWLHAELAIARGDGQRALALMSSLHTPAQGQTSSPASGAKFRARPGLLLKAAAALAAARPDAVSGVVDRRQVDAPTLEALSDVRQALLVWTAEHTGDAVAWEWLGRCAQALGLPLLAQRARAEQLAATGDLDAAIDRLLAAQAGTRGAARTDFIEASIIDVRLRQLQAQRQQWADELRRAGAPASR